MIQALGRKRLLGISIGERSIHVALVQQATGGGRVVGTAALTFTPEMSWEKPQPIGAALAQTLKSAGIKYGRAAVGLPANWLLTDLKSFPDSGADALRGMVQLLIERDYQPEGKDWVFDYAPGSRADGRVGVAVCATSQQRLSAVNAALSAGGIKPTSAFPTVAALSRQLPQSPGRPGILVHVRADGVEAGIYSYKGFHCAEWLADSITPGVRLEVEVRRLLARAVPATPASAMDVAVFSTKDKDVVESLDAAGLSACKSGGVSGAGRLFTRTGTDAAHSAAVAIAEAGLAADPSMVNLIRPRLMVDHGAAARRARIGAIAVLAVLAGAIGFATFDWSQQKAELEVLRSEIDALKEPVKLAQARIDKLNKARAWLDKRPAMLEQIRTITLAMPNAGLVWANSLSIREDLTGTFVGKAQSEKNVIELLDKLRGSGKFKEVKLLYLRQADRTAKAVSFALTFTFKAQE